MEEKRKAKEEGKLLKNAFPNSQLKRGDSEAAAQVAWKEEVGSKGEVRKKGQ
jgi:hypothetical protein